MLHNTKRVRSEMYSLENQRVSAGRLHQGLSAYKASNQYCTNIVADATGPTKNVGFLINMFLIT